VSSKTDRLNGFRSLGWTVLKTWTSQDGALINVLETCMLTWIRKDLALPPYLAKEDMGKIAGWSETFSADAVPNQMVIERIEMDYLRLSESLGNSYLP
jgi:hypothetical protein